MNKFFESFFDSISKLEDELTTIEEESYANIFILGLPRSGTTLLSQLIYRGTNSLCPNNLMARFWKSPLVGAYISKLTTKNYHEENMESLMGQTKGLDEPHEFSWFWQDMMNWSISENGELQKSGNVDWDRLRLKILSLNKILDAPIVWKPLELITDDLNMLSKVFSKSIFIFIDRESEEIANSIGLIRSSHDDSRKFWGSIPRNISYEELINKDIYSQVVDQVFYLRKHYENVLNEIPKERLMIIRYKEICLSPDKFLEKLVNLSVLNNSKLEKVLNFSKLRSFDNKITNINEVILNKIKEKGIQGYLFKSSEVF